MILIFKLFLVNKYTNKCKSKTKTLEQKILFTLTLLNFIEFRGKKLCNAIYFYLCIFQFVMADVKIRNYFLLIIESTPFFRNTFKIL